ncbi:hypothetical protein B0J13DRAFT_550606 [Dactylonectria estremocensis]|uniref:Uncharacterized protein n=1 Tax=Dactylonectria estremocensis TaxID=1079267 RepID=A0A9P9F0S1_9HYPO|nr:hypothetical protein B0J13DRAFT_550606 [Dactylonectria estremocensis]
MYRENRPGRLSIVSVVSSWSSPSDDGIIVTKHHRRLSENHTPTLSPSNMERSRQASTCSEQSCEGMTADETRDLWRCMLELQLRYGCYNSTRIEVALDAGDDGMDLMPNRFIIDTLNESVINLPDEGRELLNRHLCPSASCADKQKWKFWKKE